MTDTPSPPPMTPADVLRAATATEAAVPVRMVTEATSAPQTSAEVAAGFGPAAAGWLGATRFTPAAKKQVMLPAADGQLAAVVLGGGNGRAGEPSGPSDLLVGQLSRSLPPGTYRLDTGFGEPGWRLWRGGSAPTASAATNPPTAMSRRGWGWPMAPTGAFAERGRGGVARPRSDQHAGLRHGPGGARRRPRARLPRGTARRSRVITGDELLSQNFPMIHAVGRASSRAPRLIDIKWGAGRDAPHVTLVGKGITFDTGGLDIKPASGMLLMKKDMGGAATALALGHMIMGQGLDVRAAHSDPGGREQHLAAMRSGPATCSQAAPARTVEIGNTDAEGRLVLADALALADEEKPDTILVFATLTGAARVALGPDLPAFFTDDDALGGGGLPARAANDRRSGVADAAVARLRAPSRQRRRRHEQRLGRAVRRRHHGGAVSARGSSRMPGVSPISISMAGGRRRGRLAPRAASRRPRARCSRPCGEEFGR